jgi:hypothetical protein
MTQKTGVAAMLFSFWGPSVKTYFHEAQIKVGPYAILVL